VIFAPVMYASVMYAPVIFGILAQALELRHQETLWVGMDAGNA
jgi:hypothetical protein